MTACGNAGGNEQDKSDEKEQESFTIELRDSLQGGIRVPSGFSATVIADDLGKARDVTVRENGDIFVLLRKRNKNGNGMVAIRENQKGDGLTKAYSGKHAGRGSLMIRDSFLYHSTDSSVLRTKFRPQDDLFPKGTTETIVKGFEYHGQHGNKNFDIDGNGKLYVTVGAPSNSCQKKGRTPGSKGKDPCPLLQECGGIWQLDADKTDQHYMKDGVHFSTGIRNMVAIDWNDKEDKLYGVQHGRDQLHQLFPDKFNKDQSAKLPAEEMFLIEKGTDFGWPYCYYDGLKDKKVLAPEYGGDGDKVGRCKEKDDPIAHFPAHFAPNNLEFYQGDEFPEKYKNGAFIAFHGSWNRNEHKQWGYNVTFVPFDGKRPKGGWDSFASEFEGPERVDSPSDAEFRPCGLAEGPEGALYVVDSQVGRLWRISYDG